MKRIWQQYAARMELASLRERAMVFTAAAVVLVYVLNALLIEPELARQKRLSAEVAQRQIDIRAMQEQVQAMALARQANPDSVKRKQLEALRAQASELDAQLAEEQRKFAPPEKVGALLEEMLARNRKLQLVDMRTLPVAAISVAGGGDKPAAAPAAPGAAAKAATTNGPIYRHGVEITVSGGYLDLLAYLRELEKLPNQMYWGKLDLTVTAYPQVMLKLSVYTLSLDLAWLVV
jgi:MSHA biogenesis protein MshJ